MVTCNECGKLTGLGRIGTFWICGDCRVGEQTAAFNTEHSEQPEKHENNKFGRKTTAH